MKVNRSQKADAERFRWLLKHWLFDDVNITLFNPYDETIRDETRVEIDNIMKRYNDTE